MSLRTFTKTSVPDHNDRKSRAPTDRPPVTTIRQPPLPSQPHPQPRAHLQVISQTIVEAEVETKLGVSGRAQSQPQVREKVRPSRMPQMSQPTVSSFRDDTTTDPLLAKLPAPCGVLDRPSSLLPTSRRDAASAALTSVSTSVRPLKTRPNPRPMPVVTPFVLQACSPLPPASSLMPKNRRTLSPRPLQRHISSAHKRLQHTQSGLSQKCPRLSENEDVSKRYTVQQLQKSTSKSASKTLKKPTNLIAFLQSSDDALPKSSQKVPRTQPSRFGNSIPTVSPPTLLSSLADAAAAMALVHNAPQVHRPVTSEPPVSHATSGSGPNLGLAHAIIAPAAVSLLSSKFGTVPSSFKAVPQTLRKSRFEQRPDSCPQHSPLPNGERELLGRTRGKRGFGRSRTRFGSGRNLVRDHMSNVRQSTLTEVDSHGTNQMETTGENCVSDKAIEDTAKGKNQPDVGISCKGPTTGASALIDRERNEDGHSVSVRNHLIHASRHHTTTTSPDCTDPDVLVPNVPTLNTSGANVPEPMECETNLPQSNLPNSNLHSSIPPAGMPPPTNISALRLGLVPKPSVAKSTAVTTHVLEAPKQKPILSSLSSQPSRDNSDLSIADLPARKRLQSKTQEREQKEKSDENKIETESRDSEEDSGHLKNHNSGELRDATEDTAYRSMCVSNKKDLVPHEKNREEIESGETEKGYIDQKRCATNTCPKYKSQTVEGMKKHRLGSEQELTDEDIDENSDGNGGLFMEEDQGTVRNHVCLDSDDRENNKSSMSDESGNSKHDVNKIKIYTVQEKKGDSSSGAEGDDDVKRGCLESPKSRQRIEGEFKPSRLDSSDVDERQVDTCSSYGSTFKYGLTHRPVGSKWRKGPSMVQNLNGADFKSDESGSAAFASQDTFRDDGCIAGNNGVYEAGTGALLSLKDIAQSRNIFWAKVRGFPFWPAQHVSGFVDLSINMHFRKAEYGRRKDTDTCVMFFGSSEVAFVKRDGDVVSWEEGVTRRFHTNKRHGRMFKKAIRQARAACKKPTPIFPRDWWCSPPALDWWDRLVSIMHARDESLANIPISDDVGDDEEDWEADEVTEDSAQEADSAFGRADAEGVFWVFRDGAPVAVQRLPLDSSFIGTSIEDCVQRARRRVRFGYVLCVEFGRGDVCVEEEESLVPLQAGASNVIRVISHMSDGQALLVKLSAGEAWGYVQQPRAWPSGYLSGRPWWNFQEGAKTITVATSHEEDRYSDSPHPESSSELDCLSAPRPDILLGTLMHYEHVDGNVYSSSAETTSRDESLYGYLYDENGKDEYDEPISMEKELIKCDCGGKRGAAKFEQCLDKRCSNWQARYFCTSTHCSNERCGNRPFQSRERLLTAPVVLESSKGILADSRKKWALRCDEGGNVGAFVGEFVGDVICLTEFSKRLRHANVKNEGPYAWRLNSGFVVDARYRGNFTRFLHGSCTPNCSIQVWTDENTSKQHLGVFLKETVQKGAILTVPHHFADIGMTGESLWCSCSPRSTARRMLNPVEVAWARQRVGRRVRVEWDSGWYSGMVARYNERQKKFDILYDDGDKESLSLGFPLGKNDGTKFVWLT